MKFLSIFISLLLSTYGLTQNDMELWTGIGVEKRITKDLKFGLESQARFDNGISRMENLFAAPSLQYSFNKHFRVSAETRFMSVPYNSSTSNRVFATRYGLDLEIRKLLDFFLEDSRFNLDFRLRSTIKNEREERNDTYLRYRFKLNYNIPKTKLRPHIAVELFHHLNDQVIYTLTEVNTTHVMNKLRVRLGAYYPINKRHKVGAFVLYQRQFFSQRNIAVLGLGYSYELKGVLIKKK